MSDEPVAAPSEDIETTPPTIAELPFFAAGRFPKPDLICRVQDGRVVQTSAREFLDRVRDVGLGFTGLGLERGDRVALLSESRPDWLVADFAILAAGAVTTPIYPTLSAEQIAFIVKDSGATWAVVSTAAQLAKFQLVAATVPTLRHIVVMDAAGAAPSGSSPIAGAHAPASPTPILTLDDVAALGHRRILDGWGVGRAFHDAAKAVRPEDLATIIYTSGTTGVPKGVRLTHANLIANLRGVLQMLDLSQDDVALSFLPLCHSFERIVAYVYFCTGVSMVFAESIDTVPRDLLLVRPTVMSGVPRVFEKLYARVVERGRETKGIRRMLFRWSMDVARRRGRVRAAGAPLPLGLRGSSAVAERAVFHLIRENIGGRLRYAVSGSAPLSLSLAEWFFGIGLPILEGYGLTETSPVVAVMPLREVRLGTVGPPLPNVEVRIAGDGEILVRGANVMQGYHQHPEETAVALDGGWFHTGDIGVLDERGYLRITDRKKEVLITSGGKKIAPQPIEARLRADALITEAVVLGERRHFPSVLLTPDFAVLARRLGVDIDTAREAVDRDDVRALFQTVIDQVNDGLAQFERLKKFVVLPREFSQADGELTPTQKVKRAVVEARFKDVIDGIYR